MALTVTDLGMLLLAFLFPPLCVFIEKERLDADVLINILLTVLGWLPGNVCLASLLARQLLLVSCELLASQLAR